MIIYATDTIKALLMQTDANGCRTKKWLPDMSEIVDTTEQEREEELSAIRMNTKNDHGIALWKTEGGQVVQRTTEEIAADEFNYTLANFNYAAFEGRMIQVLPQERWFQLAISTSVAYTMNRLIEYPGRGIENFQRFKAFVAGLVPAKILTQEEVAQIFALFLEQGINLTEV